MPTYLVHGFRWPRAAIRVHIIFNDLDDAAAEYIVGPSSAMTILDSFYSLFDFLPPPEQPVSTFTLSEPPVKSGTLSTATSSTVSVNNDNRAKHGVNGTRGTKFNDWSVVKLLEQYDPLDETCVSQPYAYVADYILPVTTSVDVIAEMTALEKRQREGSQSLKRQMGLPTEMDPTIPFPPTQVDCVGLGMTERESERKTERLSWLEKLRDRLAKEQPIGWYVVVAGEEVRGEVEYPALTVNEESTETLRPKTPKTPRSAGLRGFFVRKDKGSKSSSTEA